MPSTKNLRTRGIGTVGVHAFVTAGQVLQVCSEATLLPAPTPRRRNWSHYLTQPTHIETIGRLDLQDAADGFLKPDTAPDLNLGSICSSWMARLQASPFLNHKVPFPARRTRLRWIVVSGPDDTAKRITLRLEDEQLRTLRIYAPQALAGRFVPLCQDLALHDWLLSTVTALVDLAGIGSRSRTDVVRRLEPTIDHLLHIWMPGARLDDDLLEYWEVIDRRAGLSRQWRNLLRRIRDQIAVSGINHLEAPATSGHARTAVVRLP